MLSLCLSLCLLTAPVDDTPRTAASWIWYPENVAIDGVDQTRYLRKTLTLAAPPKSARLRFRGDDSVVFRVNGEPAPEPLENGRGGAVYELTDRLITGENVLAFEIHNGPGMGGLILTGTVETAAGETLRIHSDESFKASRDLVDGWVLPGFDDAAWPAAGIVSGAFGGPWFRHPSYDLQPFLEPADHAAWVAWRDPLTAVPEGLENETDPVARLEYQRGQAVLTLDGEPRPALIYRGVVDPLTRHGRRQIELFRDAGVHVYSAYYPLSGCWPTPDTYDFSALDEIVRAYLSLDPAAQVILIFRLVPPEWWFTRHPEEMVGYAKGPANQGDEAMRALRPSYASEVWHDDMLTLWRAAIDHVEAQPWGPRVIGYHPAYGIYAEWHYYGSWTNQMPDTGPAMTAWFRRWLKQHYAGDPAALQTAWGRPVTFATAEVPGEAPRLVGESVGIRGPAQNWARDYYRCQQELTADRIESFCAVAKEATGNRALTGAYYGYYFGVGPQTSGGHLEMERLLRSPYLDYLSAPYSYSYRDIGEDGRTRTIIDAYPATGKVHLIEADTRTHLHPIEQHGRVPDEASSIAVIRREVATAMTKGCALWWTDFGPELNGGWYDDPALIGEVAKMVELAQRRLDSPREPVAEIALVVDPESCYSLTDYDGMARHYKLVDEVTTELYQIGAPFDQIFSHQLDELDLSRYKLVVMLDTLRVETARRARLKARLADKTLLWFWAPGVLTEASLDARNLTDLTGFRVDGETARPVEQVLAGDDPLLADLPSRAVYRLEPTGATPIAAATDPGLWSNPRDAETMKAYSSFAVGADKDGGVRWTFGTRHGWTDVHLDTAIAATDGFAIDARGAGAAAGTTLRMVIQSAAGGEFISPPLTLGDDWATLTAPVAAFEKADWDRTPTTEPAFPLRGMKFVVTGIHSPDDAEIRVRNLRAVSGRVSREDVRQIDLGDGFTALTIAPETATVLGRDIDGHPLLAARGEPGRRHLLSTVVWLPRELLAALADEAGVHRYLTSPEVVVTAIDDLIVLHTGVGGRHSLRLPRPATVVDALTGETVGRGATVELDLPAPSTTILELRPLGR